MFLDYRKSTVLFVLGSAGTNSILLSSVAMMRHILRGNKVYNIINMVLKILTFCLVMNSSLVSYAFVI